MDNHKDLLLLLYKISIIFQNAQYASSHFLASLESDQSKNLSKVSDSITQIFGHFD